MLLNLLFVLLIGISVGCWIAADARSFVRPKLRVASFAWNSCGSPSEAVKVQSLAIGPDPVLIPGNVSVAFQASVAATEYSPMPLSLTIKKKVLFAWVTIPCENGTGSCTYQDFCTKMPNPCPSTFKNHGFACTCPIQKGSYNVPSGPAFTISSSSLPSWMESGDYWIEARVNDKTGDEILCLDLSLTLQAN